MSAVLGLPLFLEDTTGYSTGSTDFFDIYDRPPFVHVTNRVELIARTTRVDISELNIRHGSPLKHHGITLSIQPGLEGYVLFRRNGKESMSNITEWLFPEEHTIFTSKMASRQFIGSDGKRYQWLHRTNDHEWTCLCLNTKTIVAHYDLKSVHEPKYRTSGNVLTVGEAYQALVLAVYDYNPAASSVLSLALENNRLRDAFVTEVIYREDRLEALHPKKLTDNQSQIQFLVLLKGVLYQVSPYNATENSRFEPRPFTNLPKLDSTKLLSSLSSLKPTPKPSLPSLGSFNHGSPSKLSLSFSLRPNLSFFPSCCHRYRISKSSESRSKGDKSVLVTSVIDSGPRISLMATTSPPMSSSPPLSPNLSKDDSQPFQITLDKPVVASPFPSPGSAFIPPPIPIVHEFTLPSKRGKKGNNTSPASASGTSTPNNASSSSLVQSNHSSSNNERNSDSSLSSPQLRPSPQPSSMLQPQPPVSSKVMNSVNVDNAGIDSTYPDEESSIQLISSSSSGNNTFSGSGRDTPTPSNATGYVNVIPRTPSPSGNGNATTNVNQRISTSASSTTSSRHSSLSSSRPAPPSPALSRNTSRSRGGSRRQSRMSLGASPNGNTNNTANGTTTPSKRLSALSTLSAPSNASANKRLSTLSNISTLPTVPQSQVASAVTPTKTASNIKPSGQIVIRDFAFVLTDNRHTGQGPDTPKVIKKMQKKYGPPGIRKPEKGRDSASASASSSCASSESESRRGSGFGFGWGTNAGAGFGGWWSGMWSGFGSGSRTSRVDKRENDEDAYTPTANDLSMNFNTSSSPNISQPSSPAVTPQVVSSHINEDDDSSQLLLPGLYKALYDFMPEGTAEMGLRQGDIVRVAGRGGGEGWAVVARGTIRFTDEGDEVLEFDGDNAEVRSDEAWALVPESYLELWSLDRNDEEDQYADDEE